MKRATNMFAKPLNYDGLNPDGLLYILFDSKGYANTTGYKNDRVDKLLDQGRDTYDQAIRDK